MINRWLFDEVCKVVNKIYSCNLNELMQERIFFLCVNCFGDLLLHSEFTTQSMIGMHDKIIIRCHSTFA